MRSFMQIGFKQLHRVITLLSPFLLTLPHSLACPQFSCSTFLSQMAVAVPLVHPQLATTHTKARGPVYPGRAAADPPRTAVPDDKVSWKVDWTEYKPLQYTAPPVLKGPVWADPDLMAADNYRFRVHSTEHHRLHRLESG